MVSSVGFQRVCMLVGMMRAERKSDKIVGTRHSEYNIRKKASAFHYLSPENKCALSPLKDTYSTEHGHTRKGIPHKPSDKAPPTPYPDPSHPPARPSPAQRDWRILPTRTIRSEFALHKRRKAHTDKKRIIYHTVISYYRVYHPVTHRHRHRHHVQLLKRVVQQRSLPSIS
jgi:hypothetical protein